MVALPSAANLFRHMVKVLRLKPGTGVFAGRWERNRIHRHHRQRRQGKPGRTIQESRVAAPAPPCPALPCSRGSRKETSSNSSCRKPPNWAVAEVIPFARPVPSRGSGKAKRRKRFVRWQRIVQEAARQSGRSSVPQVSLAGSMAEVVNMSGQAVKVPASGKGKNVNRLKDTLAGTGETGSPLP